MVTEFIIALAAVAAVALVVFLWARKKYPEQTTVAVVGIAIAVAAIVSFLVKIFFSKRGGGTEPVAIVPPPVVPISKPAAEAVKEIVEGLEQRQAQEAAKPTDQGLCKEIDGV